MEKVPKTLAASLSPGFTARGSKRLLLWT